MSSKRKQIASTSAALHERPHRLDRGQGPSDLQPTRANSNELLFTIAAAEAPWNLKHFPRRMSATSFSASSDNDWNSDDSASADAPIASTVDVPQIAQADAARDLLVFASDKAGMQVSRFFLLF